MIDLPRGRRLDGPPPVFDLAAIRAERSRLARRQAAARPPITAILPVPRAVTLAGRSCVVGELRLGDLAELQAWLEERADHPLAAEPADDRRAQLAAAWPAAAAWPIRLGSDEAAPHVATRAYRRAFLWIALRRHNPDLEPGDIDAIEAAATPAEWAALQRVAWAVSPKAEIVAEVAPDPSPSTGTDWVDVLYRIMDSLKYTPDQVRDLTLGQFRALASGGKPADQGREATARAAQARRVLGLD